MKKITFISVGIVVLLAGALTLYLSRNRSDWDELDTKLVEKSVSITEVLTSPEKYLNRPIILRTNWIPGVEGPWLADHQETPLEDNSHLSFQWATPGVYDIFSEKGVPLNTYPVSIPSGPVLAEGIFRIGDFKYYWGNSPDTPHLELSKVYFIIPKK